MKEFVCIVCPNGCNLCVEEKTMTVTGNRCKRGLEFAEKEITSPERSLCTTVRTVFADCPVLPVRVSSDIPKSKIFEVKKEIDKVAVSKRLNRGDIVIKNVCNLGCDVIATSDRLLEGL